MLVARVISPASKLATHRPVHDDTANTSLGRVLGGVSAALMICPGAGLAARCAAGDRAAPGTSTPVGSALVLYDLTSTADRALLRLAARGHSRDGSAMIRRSSSA
ncbi:MAG: hypothetical protein IPL57_08155 [Rubrivivax sp.]|nr:hypothetical protein [Rubrivivax sp.]